MLSPNHIITAPLPRRSPEDSYQSWQSFTAEIGQHCNKDLKCWYDSIVEKDGPISIACGQIDSSCVASVLSTASVIYTSLFPPVSASQISLAPSIEPTSSSPLFVSSNTDLAPSRDPPTQSTYLASSAPSGINPTPSSPSDRELTQVATSTSHGLPTNDAQIPSSIDAGTGTGIDTISKSTSTTGKSLSSNIATSNSVSLETSSPVSTSKAAPTSTISPDTSAIVGGTIGGLLLIILIVSAALFIARRRRRSGAPPSAEFMHMTRGSPGKPALLDGGGKAVQNWLIPLARQRSVEDNERPPDFSPGTYTDPVLEKVHASAVLRDQYGERAEKEWQVL